MLCWFSKSFDSEKLRQASEVAADQIPVNVQDLRAVTSNCIICFESTLLVAASASCLHEPRMCNDCMSQYVDAAFQQSLTIHCPFNPKPTCCEVLVHKHIFVLALVSTLATGHP